MGTHPLIERQLLLLQQTSKLLVDYERSVAETEAILAREQAEAEKEWKKAQDDFTSIQKQLDKMWADIEVIVAKRKKNFENGIPKNVEQDQSEKHSDHMKRLFYTIQQEQKALIYSLASDSISKFVFLSVFLSLSSLLFLFDGQAYLTFSGICLLIGGIIFAFKARQKNRNIWIKRRNHYATITYCISYISNAIKEDFDIAKGNYTLNMETSNQRMLTSSLQQEKGLSGSLTSLTPYILNYLQATQIISTELNDTAKLNWQPTQASVPLTITRIGSIAITYKEQRLPSFPLFVPFPGERNLLLQASGNAYPRAATFMQGLLLRVIATQPPGMVQFTFIDPVGFGQSVAPFMQLGKYDSSLVGNRIWTEASHIEQQLASISEYLAQVNQHYLWGATPTIEQYNRQNPRNALPYRVLVVLGFPCKFTTETAHSLLNIAQNGPRCGVCVAMIYDESQPQVRGYTPDSFAQMSSVLRWEGQNVHLDDAVLSRAGINVEIGNAMGA